MGVVLVFGVHLMWYVCSLFSPIKRSHLDDDLFHIFYNDVDAFFNAKLYSPSDKNPPANIRICSRKIKRRKIERMDNKQTIVQLTKYQNIVNCIWFCFVLVFFFHFFFWFFLLLKRFPLHIAMHCAKESIQDIPFDINVIY